jgi:hypothetical protein
MQEPLTKVDITREIGTVLVRTKFILDVTVRFISWKIRINSYSVQV